jgi:hypothetical protein
MIAGRGSKLSRNAKKPIQSGKNVGRQRCSRAVFALGDGLVQQCPDFLQGDLARAAGPVPSVAYFVWLCSKDFPFQGVKQRR